MAIPFPLRQVSHCEAHQLAHRSRIQRRHQRRFQKYDGTGTSRSAALRRRRLEQAALKWAPVSAIPRVSWASKASPAATTGVAADYLLPKEVDTIGVFGAGEQAFGQVEALCAVRPRVKHVKVYSPTSESRTQFAEKVRARLDVTATAVDEPRECAKGAQALVTATNSNDPIIRGEWIEPGMHIVTTLGGDKHFGQRKELYDEAVQLASFVVVNSKEQIVLDQKTDLISLFGEAT